MKASILLLIFGCTVALAHLGGHKQWDNDVGNDEENPYADRNYNNPTFAEFTPPSAEELADLNKLRNLRVLDFYEALDELYLTGGFDKAGTINYIILSQKDIPNNAFNLLINILRKTRGELKNGDSSLNELNTVLKNEKDEQTKELLTAVKEAIRNITNTSDDETFLQKISKIKLESKEDLKNLNLGKGEKGTALAGLLNELKSKIAAEDLTILSKAVQNGFYSGIGGTDSVKNTVVAGARLVYNMGQDNANKKCLELAKAYKKDKQFKNKLDSANQIVKRLNRTDGEYGYKLLFDVFFDSQAPRGNMIFLPSKLLKMETFLPFLQVLQKADTQILFKMISSISKDRSRMRQFQWFIDKLQNDTSIASKLMTERFGVEITEELVPIYRSIIEYITAFSVDSAYFLRYLRSVKDIADTGNFKNFMDSMVRFTQLARDDKWRDVWYSIREASDIAKTTDNILLAPFKGLNETVIESYEEVFLALKMLLEGGKVEEKCKFIEEFFTGLKDKDNVLKAIGLPVEDMHQWIDSTEYIDALVDVLKASETFSNLNRLLEFHGKYTTVDKKPLESMDLIDNFIRFLEQSGRWNKKNLLYINYDEANIWVD